jgi:hypothetical protein
MLRDTPTLRGRAATVCLLAGLGLLSSCAQPDRGNCLQSQTVTEYHPTEVFMGGGSGYTHEYLPHQEQECSRWEYPDGRPKS